MRTRADILADLELVESYTPTNYASSMLRANDRNRLRKELEEVEQSVRKLDFYRNRQTEKTTDASKTVEEPEVNDAKELKFEMDGYTVEVKIYKTIQRL
ncbi:hypothetical protein [Macrococcus lamae]|uniref:Uncharacterized protein n=1 Tax=Macrococcus lamae TaxID=198484 RepID=A0A4R6BXJ5_9STAP|nr:hypothetical protein [Macrococcus lamae]TDM12738.1 hypothetical protein ERX29_01675 [Macrococcus lamae]